MSKQVAHLAVSVIAFAALVVLTSSPAQAQVVTDQNFGPPTPHNLSAILAEGFAYAAQTVTAGVSGPLVGADVYFGEFAEQTVPWEVRVHQVVNGTPTGTVLALVTIPSSQVPSALDVPPQFVHVDFPSPPTFTAGQQFALVVHLQGTEGSPGLFAGSWQGNADGLYPGGQLFFSLNGTTFLPDPPPFDVFFRTFVQIPEPSSGCGVMLAMFAAAGTRRRRAR